MFAYLYNYSYPLILSLEIHCSIPQQEVMAKHLKTLLEGNKSLQLMFTKK